MADNTVPDPKRVVYLGMAKGDLDGMWYAKYWNPEMAPLPQHVVDALENGPQASLLLPALDHVAELSDSGYQAMENGYGLDDNGAAVISILTKMPNVTPAMWDWWFAWHGSDTRRYKLWNPSAHMYAGWKDGLTSNPGKSDRDGYQNRVSFIDEYVGSTKMSLALHFVQPEAMGFDPKKLADPNEATVICGRVGLSEAPIDSGYLIHYIRKTKDGAEMRSRFWLGGKYITPRAGSKLPADAAQRNDAATLWQAYSLLVHCSKEMNHLARFLPDIYQEAQKIKE